MQEQESRVPTVFIIPLTQFFVGLFLFIALLHGQRDLIIWTLLILGLVSGTKLWSRFSLSGVKCSSTIDKSRVFPGEKLTLHMKAENAKFLPVWLQMKVPVDGSLYASSSATTLTKESGLLWYQRVRFKWELTAQRRGLHQIGPPRVMVGDLFGFFPREKEAAEFLQVLVYPKLVPLKSFSLPRREFFGVPGGKSPVQDPVYLLGTRDYQHWRPARYIHWKASARHNRLQEKLCEPTEQEKVLLAVDVDQFVRNQAGESFEHTLEIVASLAVRLDQQGCAVGLVTNGIVVGGGPRALPIARNPQQLPAILEVLARLKMDPTGDFLDVLHRGSELSWGLSCVLFSYEKDGATLATQRYFTTRRIPMVLIVCQSTPFPEGDEPKIRGTIYSLEDVSSEGARST